MKPNYQSSQPERSFTGRGYHNISRNHRPIGRGRSMMHKNKNTVNMSHVSKPVNLTNTKVSKNTPSAPKDDDKEAKGSRIEKRTANIVPIKYPSVLMTDEQLNLLEIAILKAIDKMNEGPIHKRPQFISYKKINGTLSIECYNLKSLLWLKNLVRNLKPWEDAQLKLMKPGDEFATVILPKVYPKHIFSSKELNTLESEILQAIDKIPPESFVPKFVSCEKKFCSLKVTGFNNESVQWLRTILENLSWDGPEVSVFDIENVPMIYKIQLTIPGKSVETESTLARLARQNKGINISDWQFVSETVEKDNLVINMLVKPEDKYSLSTVDFKLFYMFQQIKVSNIKPFNPTKPFSTSDNGQSHVAAHVQQNSDELPDNSSNSPGDEDEHEVMNIDDIEDLSFLLEKVDEIENDIEQQESEQEI